MGCVGQKTRIVTEIDQSLLSEEEQIQNPNNYFIQPQLLTNLMEKNQIVITQRKSQNVQNNIAEVISVTSKEQQSKSNFLSPSGKTHTKQIVGILKTRSSQVIRLQLPDNDNHKRRVRFGSSEKLIKK